MPRHSKDTVAVLGIDIGKNTFHLVGLNKRGAIILRQKLSRTQLEAKLANLPPCLVGMEACVGAHHLSRRLKTLGHDSEADAGQVCHSPTSSRASPGACCIMAATSRSGKCQNPCPHEEAPISPACRRARRCQGRALRVALKRVSLDRLCARRLGILAVGAGESLRRGRTREMDG